MTQISSHRRTLKVSGMGANEWNLVQDLLGRRGGRPIRFVCCVFVEELYYSIYILPTFSHERKGSLLLQRLTLGIDVYHHAYSHYTNYEIPAQ